LTNHNTYKEYQQGKQAARWGAQLVIRKD